MVKLFLLFVGLIVGVYFVLHGFSIHTVKASDFLADLLSQKSRFEKIEPKNQQTNISLPMESRAKTAGFQPILKDNFGIFAVPTAHASIILDANSGNILYEESAHEHRQIASLTKLYTALLVMENVTNLDEEVIITEEALLVEGTRVGCPRSGFCTGTRLQVGERLTVRDLLKASLMNSANDAATALGIHVSGSADAFAKLMNERAKKLGLEDSNFCTPSGLEIDGRESECFSSAHDIGKITIEALKHDELWQIMQIESATINSIDNTLSHDIINTDKLLGQVPNLIGTKTGFTPLAGYSLLAVVSDYTGERKIVAVVLDDYYRWDSIRAMFDWSFQAHEWK